METGRTADAIIADLNAAFAQIDGAIITVIAPPTIRRIGTGGGFSLRVRDYDSRGSDAPAAVTGDLLGALNADSQIGFALRPILMTSFAFILGTVPLVVATGAEAELRQALGIAVFFGMSGVTFFGLIFTPIFHTTIRGVTARSNTARAQAA